MGIRPVLTDQQAKLITGMIERQRDQFASLLNNKPHALGTTDLDEPIKGVISIMDETLHRLNSAEPFPEPPESGK